MEPDPFQLLQELLDITRPGGTLANEIVLIVAHLDDEPGGPVAPGADDNASGSVGVLTAARILSQCHFARTVRFALVTGEEQGLLGSWQYAADAAAAGDQIVAVLNLDMIAWDARGFFRKIVQFDVTLGRIP